MTMVADPGTTATEIDALRRRIDGRLAKILPRDVSGQDLVRAAMREAALSPGKRLRPLLAMLAAEDLGADAQVALDAGCAIELLHTASLVLDDLPCMDDALHRRGEVALHLRFGEDIAVLSSIGLVSLAYGLVAGSSTVDPVRRAQLVTILSDAIGVAGLVGGQYADLRGGARISRADVAVTNDRKTGALFVAAVDGAAVVAGADAQGRAALRGFAVELGRAFQILDDLLDEEEDDAGGRRTTLVGLIGPDAARRRLRGHVEAATAALDGMPGGAPRLRTLVRLIFAEAAARRRQRTAAADGAAAPG